MPEPTWGIRFNQHPQYERVPKGEIPKGCPAWLASHQISTWQEQGLVVWNNIDKKIECLRGTESLRLLSELSNEDEWKSDGVSITRLVHRVQLPQAHQRKRKKGESEPEMPKGEDVYEEILHLPPKAGTELIELLEAKKQIISQMAEREQERSQEALRQVWDRLIELSREKELREFDFQGRSFESQRDDASRIICHYQSAEGRLWLAKDKLFWNTCGKREGHAENSHYFVKLAEAVDWVEKEIVELANQPEVKKERQFLSSEEKKANQMCLKEKLRNGPFWIDPQWMEPGQVTYRILIDLKAKPLSYKSFETICGDTYQYPDRYPAPTKLADELNLDVGHFKIEQLLGDHSDRYRITSLTTYYRESAAAEQAQRVWDQSWILRQFKSGQITRAHFGYQEVETDYIVYLGACQEAGDPWHEGEDRTAFMEWKALSESLSYALDVNDYRDFLGVTTKFISDERLLEFMHQNRVESKLIPDEVRRESKIWLAQHEPLE